MILSQSDLKRKLENIPREKLLELRRVGHRIFLHYMSSKDAILDATVALARQLLNRPVPTHSAVTPNGTHYLQRGIEEEDESEVEEKWSRPSWQETFDRWNVEFFPWQRIPSENPSRYQAVRKPITCKRDFCLFGQYRSSSQLNLATQPLEFTDT